MAKRSKYFQRLLSNTPPEISRAAKTLWESSLKYRNSNFAFPERQRLSTAGHHLEELLLANAGLDSTEQQRLSEEFAQAEKRFMALLLTQPMALEQLPDAFAARNRASIALYSYQNNIYGRARQFLIDTGEQMGYQIVASEKGANITRTLTLDMAGAPKQERQGEKRTPQERTVPSYNRQIEALRDAPRHPEADSWFENLAITRFEQTLADASTSKEQRDRLLTLREHFIHIVSESIRNDLALAIFRARLSPDEVNIPAFETARLRQQRESIAQIKRHRPLTESEKLIMRSAEDKDKELVMQAVYKLAEQLIPDEERMQVQTLFAHLSTLVAIGEIDGEEGVDVRRELDQLLNLQGDESYQANNDLLQSTDSTQILNWHSFLDNSRKNGSFDSAALLLRQMYSSAPTNLQKSIEGLIDGKLTPTVNGLEWQAAGIDLQKWSAFQQHYQHSQEYLEGLLKDRKTPLKEVVYALIVANKSATLYSRELNKRLQTVSRYQHVLAAQNDIKITVENGEVDLERVEIEEPTEREMLQNLGNAVKEAE